MRRRSLFPLVLAVIAGALLAGGCGSSELSRADYEKQVNTINRDLEREFDRFQKDAPTKTQLLKAADIIEESSAKLEKIDAPKDVRTIHDELVATVRQLGESMRLLAPALDAKPGKKRPALTEAQERELMRAQQQSQEAIEQLQDEQKRFKKAGYKIELGAGRSSDER